MLHLLKALPKSFWMGVLAAEQRGGAQPASSNILPTYRRQPSKRKACDGSQALPPGNSDAYRNSPHSKPQQSDIGYPSEDTYVRRR